LRGYRGTQVGLVLNFRALLHEALGEAMESRAPFV
jgi:hypothetical protein